VEGSDLSNSSEVGGKTEMVQRELMRCKVTDLDDGASIRRAFGTQVGHVEVVPDDSLVRCDNRCFGPPEVSNWVAFRYGARGFDSRQWCDARHRGQLSN
jgi:hypothetical protein